MLCRASGRLLIGCVIFIIKERKGFPRFFLPKYLIAREQKFQHNVSLDWSRNKRKAMALPYLWFEVRLRSASTLGVALRLAGDIYNLSYGYC